VGFVIFPLLFLEFLRQLASVIFDQYIWDHQVSLRYPAHQIENLVGIIISSSLLFIAYLLVHCIDSHSSAHANPGLSVLILMGTRQTAWDIFGDQAEKPSLDPQYQYQPPRFGHQQPGVAYQSQYPVYVQPPAEKGVVLQE
jgi:hypothetical protein